MKNFCGLSLIWSVKRVFSISEEFLIDFRGRTGLLSKQRGVETVLMLPSISEAENQGSRSQAAGCGCVLIESRDSSWWLIKRWGSCHPATPGNELLLLGYLPPEKEPVFGIRHFLISLGRDENEPPPSLWLSFSSKWSDGERPPSRNHRHLRAYCRSQSSHYGFLFLQRYEK